MPATADQRDKSKLRNGILDPDTAKSRVAKTEGNSYREVENSYQPKLQISLLLLKRYTSYQPDSLKLACKYISSEDRRPAAVVPLPYHVLAVCVEPSIVRPKSGICNDVGTSKELRISKEYVIGNDTIIGHYISMDQLETMYECQVACSLFHDLVTSFQSW